MSAKAKGTKNEHKSRAYLERAGYAVTRSGGSLGAWDLIGIGPGDVVLVQVKSNRMPGLAEMAVLREFVVPSNCRKLVHRWNDYAREPIVREVPSETPETAAERALSLPELLEMRRG